MQKISDLEVDLYSKRIEVQSMSDTIKRLNEKLQDVHNKKTEVSEESFTVTSDEKCVSFNESVINDLFSDIVENIPSVQIF